MRMILNCFECQNTRGLPNISVAEYNDSGIFHQTCSNGHQSVTVSQEEKYALLFEIACHAINDGYYREAVSSFAASLERFFEYALRVLSTHSGTSPELFKACWKEVSNQSERQLGAFVFLWASTFHEKPLTLTNDNTAFRNRVVHKGEIPSKEDAVKFGEVVAAIIGPMQESLTSRASGACEKIRFALIRELSEKAATPGATATASMNFFLRNITAKPGDLSAHLKSLKDFNKALDTASAFFAGRATLS